jgi:hypothetical protein
MRAIAIGVTLALALLIGGRAFAGASCDGSIEKAKGKLVACECGAIAKLGVGGAGAAITKCQGKFQKACTKAKTKGGCVVQSETCGAAQGEGDTFATQHCAGSPSGAFLE